MTLIEKIEPIASMKKTFKKMWSFRAQKACLKIYTFLQTDSIYEVTLNS